MKRDLSDAAWRAMRGRIATRAVDDRIQEEIRLACDLMTAFPELTRDQALKRAADKLTAR